MTRRDSDGAYFPEGMPLPRLDAKSRHFCDAYHSPDPVARERRPYNLAVVELDDCDGTLLISNVVTCPDAALWIDLPVEVVSEHRSDGQSLYRFRPIEAVG